MSLTRVAALLTLLVGVTHPALAQNVRLEFHDGKVSLNAQNASLRAILTEWARLGGTQVVNMDRLSGPPVTLQLTDVPETQALDIILRGNAGYIAGQRAEAGSVGARSSFDRILVVPTAGTANVVNARPAAPAPSPQPFGGLQPFGAQQRFPQADPDNNPASDVGPDDEPPNRNIRVNVPRGAPNQTPPQPFQPQDENPTGPPATAPAPTNPFGVQPGSARPGMITPVPQQPERPRTQPDSEP